MPRAAEFEPLVGARGGEDQAGLVSVEVRLDVDVEGRVGIAEMGLVEAQPLDEEARLLLLLFPLRVEDPVPATLLVALQVYFRALELHFRHHDAPAQERQQAQLGLHRIGTEKVVFPRPIACSRSSPSRRESADGTGSRRRAGRRR